MAISEESNQLELVVSSNTPSSYEGLLESQKELLSKQIGQLQYIVSTQCQLTGVNPLSQEMAAGALSIKIGKRPRDLLNPKAIKYMQLIFSLKDEISKKEIRSISALFGLTATQVRDFFTGQRSRVRRLIRLSREKASQSTQRVEEQDGTSCSNLDLPSNPVPLNSMGPSSSESPSCSMHDEVLPGMDDSDKYFIDNIFNLLRKEETFAGQVKLLEWVLQIQNASVLYWFLTNGGVMILATWLSQAAIEEQTSVLHVILRVLCHLPLHKALPVHMSAILQSVNKLRFYRGSDISNRAKSLLSRWSKMFARSQAVRRPNAVISAADTQNEMLLKQSIGEIMENESLESRIDIPGATLPLQGNSENSRNLGSSQSIKLLTAPSDDSNVKLLRGVSSSHTRERRKVQLVEQPGQKMAGRNSQVTRSVSTTQGRPLSADDIQKAKMRAQFMRTKYGKIEVPQTSSTSQASTTLSASKVYSQTKVEEHMPSTSQATMKLSVSEAHVQPTIVEHKKPVKLMPGATVQGKGNLDSEESVWKKCKRFQISWVTPPEIIISKEWGVCAGENSKEIDVQNNRIRREKEVFYKTDLEIPANPKEPWDREADYDDSLTPEIPTEQLPDDDNMVTEEISGHENLDSACTSSYAPGTTSENIKNMPEPDLELLAVLLKNPEIVFALTSGQGGNLSSEQTVKLLDAIKANGVGNLMNNLVEKKEEDKVEVSLPSPTPSSNPVTSGWRQESAKNIFSRQNVTVNGDTYAIPGVYFQENSMPSPALAESPAIPSLTQQAIPPSIHQRFPDVVSGRRNTSDVVSDHRNLPDVAMVADRRNTLDLVNDRRNIPAAYFSPAQGRLQAQPQPELPAQTWTTRQGSALSSYSPADRSTTYNAYSTRDYGQSGPSWARTEGYGREPGFESWSPDNSPDRSHEYMAGRNYSPAGMISGHGHNYNYGPEMPRMQRNPSRYRDRGGRNGNSRWRDRRR